MNHRGSDEIQIRMTDIGEYCIFKFEINVPYWCQWYRKTIIVRRRLGLILYV